MKTFQPVGWRQTIPVFVLISLLVTCAGINAPEPDPTLVITRGTYQPVAAPTAEDWVYAITFHYAVSEQPYHFGGYHLQMDDTTWELSLYELQLRHPEMTYTVNDTFRVSQPVRTAPQVAMTVYQVGGAGSDKTLAAEAHLRRMGGR